MSTWDKLSMADRAKYIKLAVQNGVTSLGDIRDTYNKYAIGGWRKDISDVEGGIVLVDSEGNRTPYYSARDAMAAMGEGYSYKQLDPNFGYDGKAYRDSRSLLPTVDVVAQVPKSQLNKALINEERLNKPVLTLEDTSSKPEINDPIRNGIFEGKYGTARFTPTDDNIRRYLRIYENDKKVNEGYGWHQWGKVATEMGKGAVAALSLAAVAPIIGSAIVSPAGQTLIGEAAGGMALHTGANELYKGITGSNQGYMADAADWIADKYEGSMLQDILNKGGIYLPGDREDFKTVMEYSDPAAYTSRPLTMGYNALARGVNRVYNSVAPKLQGMQKYYHGTNGEFYDPRNAFTGTSYDMGLHASIDPKISNAMTDTTGDPHVLSFYGPKPKTTTIDTGRNDLASQLTNSRLREVYPNIPESEYTYIGQLKKEADGLVKELSKSTLSKKERTTIDQRLAEINSEGSRILSDHGYDVVGYNNINLNEGGGGASVFITDPTSIYKSKTLITPTNLRNSELYPFLSRRTPMGVKDIWGGSGERYSREAYTLDPSYMYEGYGINGNFNNLLFAPYKNSADPASQLDRNKLKIGQEINLKDFLTKEELQKISSFNKDISNRLVKSYSDEGYFITPEERTVIEGNILNDMKVKIVDDGELDASAWVTGNTIYIPKKTLDAIDKNKGRWTLDELLIHELEHAQRDKLLDILNTQEAARARLAENPFDVPTSARMLARMKNKKQKMSGTVKSEEEAILRGLNEYRNSTTYAPEELEALEDAYQFSDDYLIYHNIVPDLEKGATNRQIRYNISQAHGGVKHEELNKIIDEMSDEEILNQVLESNAYGRDFYGKIMNDQLNTPWNSQREADAFIKNKANAIRKALKYVGVGAGVGLGLDAVVNGSNTFGGGGWMQSLMNGTLFTEPSSTESNEEQAQTQIQPTIPKEPIYLWEKRMQNMPVFTSFFRNMYERIDKDEMPLTYIEETVNKNFNKYPKSPNSSYEEAKKWMDTYGYIDYMYSQARNIQKKRIIDASHQDPKRTGRKFIPLNDIPVNSEDAKKFDLSLLEYDPDIIDLIATNLPEGYDIYEALTLPIHETHLGRRKTNLSVNEGRIRALINNHNYELDLYYFSDIAQHVRNAAKKLDIKKGIGDLILQTHDLETFKKNNPKLYKEMNRDAKERFNKKRWEQSNSQYKDVDVPYMMHALLQYRDGKYNRGEPGYVNDTKEYTKKLKQSPGLRKYLISKGYIK